jgi:hypothetical protein
VRRRSTPTRIGRGRGSGFGSRTTHSDCPSARPWDAVQYGLNELLSGAVKRRAGIELLRQGVDVDAGAAVSMVGKYRQQVLKSV